MSVDSVKAMAYCIKIMAVGAILNAQSAKEKVVTARTTGGAIDNN